MAKAQKKSKKVSSAKKQTKNGSSSSAKSKTTPKASLKVVSKSKLGASKQVKKTAKKPGNKAAAKISAKTTAKTTAKTAKKPVKAPVKAAQTGTARAKTQMGAAAKTAQKLVLPNIQPLFNRVLVRPVARPERTAGGLYIPDSTEHKPLEGEVLAIGHGKRSKKGGLRPLDVQKGDQVLYSAYAGTDVQIEGEKFLILTEEEILGVVS